MYGIETESAVVALSQAVEPVRYHWQNLPLVSFLSRQNTSFVATNVCLSRQTYLCVCHDKIRRKVCLSRQTFVTTNTCFVEANTRFVATKLRLSRQNIFLATKHVFAATKRSSQQQQKRYLWQLPPTTVRQRGSAAFPPTLHGV